MLKRDHVTVGEIANLYSQPSWRIRRCVDELNVEIPRAGQYRLVPRSLLGRIAVELERRGWLPAGDVASDHVEPKTEDRQEAASP